MNADIYDLFDNGKGFENPLTALSQGTNATISQGKTQIAGLQNVTDPVRQALNQGGLTQDKINATNAMYGSAGTSVGTLVNYGDQTVSEAFSRIGTSTAYTSGLKQIGREPTTCDLINNAFGIIQQKGQEWLAAFDSALASVAATLDDLMEVINDVSAAGLAKIRQLAGVLNGYVDQAIGKINLLIAEVTAGIAAELAHLESMVKSCVNFCMTFQLTDWLKDNCVAAAIGKMASKDLKGML
uniref:DUF7217 domain-containing protein n=1 Tax=Serratia phage Kevin TaxID=3161161 RepID=A0AAU8KWM5_9CAUD